MVQLHSFGASDAVNPGCGTWLPKWAGLSTLLPFILERETKATPAYCVGYFAPHTDIGQWVGFLRFPAWPGERLLPVLVLSQHPRQGGDYLAFLHRDSLTGEGQCRDTPPERLSRAGSSMGHGGNTE